jgi:glyoxylate carboligase
MTDNHTYRLPGTVVVVSIDIRRESRTVQSVRNKGLEELLVETIEVSIFQHMRFLDPGLVVISCVVNVGIAIFEFDTHKEVPNLRSRLRESVFTVGLN